MVQVVPAEQPRLEGVVWTLKWLFKVRLRETLVAPASPDATTVESFLFVSVTLAVTLIVAVKETDPDAVVETLSTVGRVVSTVKITCSVLLTFPEVSFRKKRAV